MLCRPDRARRLAFLLALFACSAPSTAQTAPDSACTEATEASLHAVLARNPDTKAAARGELRQLSCASIPGPDGDELVAIANFVDRRLETMDDRSESYTVVLASLDPSGRRVHRHHVASTSEDATTLFRGGEFTLEADFHDLAPGGGVIGVAVTSSALGASAPENRWGDEFALFVPEGRGFRRVLGLARYRQEAIVGCLNAQCEGARWTTTIATLMPGERADDGWRRLVLRLDAEESAVDPEGKVPGPTSTTLPLVHRDGTYRQEDGSPPPGSEYYVLVPW